MDPRRYVLALLLALIVFMDMRSVSDGVQLGTSAPRVERPRALVERFEKPRPA